MTAAAAATRGVADLELDSGREEGGGSCHSENLLYGQSGSPTTIDSLIFIYQESGIQSDFRKVHIRVSNIRIKGEIMRKGHPKVVSPIVVFEKAIRVRVDVRFLYLNTSSKPSFLSILLADRCIIVSHTLTCMLRHPPQHHPESFI